jgi:hypothetical protein
MNVIGQLHAPAPLPGWQRASDNQSIGVFVGLRAGVDIVAERILAVAGIRTRVLNPNSPALYRATPTIFLQERYSEFRFIFYKRWYFLFYTAEF